jgi:hypothetical protein
MLAGRLSGHAELGSDLRPSDAEFDGVVDQRREFGLCLLLCNAGALDPLQHLRWRHPGNLLWHAGCFPWRLVLPIWPSPLGSRARLALRFSHAIQHAASNDNPESPTPAGLRVHGGSFGPAIIVATRSAAKVSVFAFSA